MQPHYHGTPFCPKSCYDLMTARQFCVSFYHGKHEVKNLPECTTTLMLDNGAFTAHTKKIKIDWSTYYSWVEEHLSRPTDWYVIPDVIEGDEDAQDELLAQAPGHLPGVPVWHLHESLDRLCRLVDAYPKVCFGSSGEYWNVGSQDWMVRVDAAFRMVLDRKPKIHMLRGLAVIDRFPFDSADSTNVARNFWVKGDFVASRRKLVQIRDRVEARMPMTWEEFR